MIAILIMAAGKGTRMNSDLPKVLHAINGKPLIDHVLIAARQMHPERLVVIVGHQRDEVMRVVGSDGIQFAVQDPQLGTGHAVMQTKPLLNDFLGDVVILSGDVPLLRAPTLQRLLVEHRAKNADATVLTTQAQNPTGYGRIIRNKQGNFVKIVEEREASDSEKVIKEVNSGIYCFRSLELFAALSELKPGNSKGEYYLTDVIQILNAHGKLVQAVDIADFWEVCGINTIPELKAAEDRLIRSRAIL